MPRLKRETDPLFWINTDIACYPTNHPDDKHGSPFLKYWLKEGYAYVNPVDDRKEAEYDAVLELIEQGDPVFAYEDSVGIVAMGIVQEKPSLEPCDRQFDLYPKPGEIIKRFAVEWDTEVTMPYQKVLELTGYVRGAIRQRGTNRQHTANQKPDGVRKRDDAALYDLRARSQAWTARNDRERADAVLAKLREIEGNSEICPKEQREYKLARIGQGRFRTNLLKIEQQCRVTGVDVPAHLVASHIKPWVLCEGDEHWDGNNGLLLAPHVDHLFDRGRISFANDGMLLVSRFQDVEVLHAWSLPTPLNVGKFNQQQQRYLDFHRRFVFERPRPLRTLASDADLVEWMRREATSA